MKTNMGIKLFSPQEFKKYLKDKQIYQKVIKTPAGLLSQKSTDEGIFETAFVETDLTASDSIFVTNALLLAGTPFQLQVWQAALKIRPGTSCSYQELAEMIGKPNAHRAVANALGANKIAYFVPCHRIKRKNGELGGYAWGIERKQALLKAEKE